MQLFASIPDRQSAISRASIDAAKASAVLGMRAIDAIDSLAWLPACLPACGNRALVADVVVAFGALRATVSGARTNVSFGLAALSSGGCTPELTKQQHPSLWAMVGELNAALDRIDALTGQIDHLATPTDAQ